MPLPHTPHPKPHNPPHPSIIIFDLGGVLVRICHGWAKACEYNGFELPAVLRDPAAAAKLDDIGIRFETGITDEATYLREAADLTGFTREQIQTALHHWIISPYPGAAQLVQEVADLGLPTACLSNTNATHWAMMNGQADLRHAALPLHLLTHRFASHLIGAMKPNPRIFEHVETALNLPPESILFFEDHPPNIAGAKARGWQVEPIDPTGDSPGQVRQHLRLRGLAI